ncbi:MAG: dehydrogenase [Porticoccaceae bacterium]|nr:MAG: dehydrogenase [Porticoccaceae bacterium]
MDTGLRDRVVLVTGATANIGRAILLAFAAEGARVVGVGRDEEAGARLEARAREAGAAQARFVRADLLEPDTPRNVLAAAEELGPLAVLVNNLGGNVGFGVFAQSDPATWQADLELNLLTTLRMTRAALPGMIERRAGRIVNIGSTAGIVGDYGLPLYSVAKGAVHAFTRVLAREVGEYGITVNCVAPYGTLAEDPEAFSRGSRFHPERGFFRRVLASSPPEERARRARRGVLPRELARPEEVAAAVVYLASDQAAFVTGRILTVDGGTLL